MINTGKEASMKKYHISLGAIIIALVTSCGPIPYYNRDTSPPDLTPPQLKGIKTTSPHKIILIFDEEANLNPSLTRISPSLKIISIEKISNHSTEITVTLEKQIPGREYRIKTEATDRYSNSISLVKKFYGYNSKIPTLLINEFTTRGSGKHPDIVEIYVVEGGNMGGITFYNGTRGNFSNTLTFPSFPVKRGDFILIHCKPTGKEEEINETKDKKLSRGYDASENAYDFWLLGGKGLSGNNGTLSIYTSPYGEVIDGVTYSNRSSDSDSRYRGFGKRETMERADELTLSGKWKTSGEKITPEDAINPDGSTGTRSICRNNPPIDTDSKGDWHIVPTRGASFGKPNTNRVYSK